MKVSRVPKPKAKQQKANSPNQSSQEAGTSDSAGPCCNDCGKEVTDEVRALKCDKCDTTWKCVQCLEMPIKVYDFIASGDRHGLCWFCDTCKQGTLDVAAAIDKLSMKLSTWEAGLEQRMQDMDTAVADKLQEFGTSFQSKIEQKVMSRFEERLMKLEEGSTCSDNIQRIESKVDEIQSNTDRVEEEEIARRQTSLIIHGIAESTSDEISQRVDDDLMQVAAMMDELKIDGVNVEKVIRLGKKPVDEKDKPRPMKLVVDSLDNKIRIIRNAKNLRLKKEGGWSKVFVHQDLTPKQREARNVLVKLMKERIANGEKNLTIVNGKIVTRKVHGESHDQN